MRALLPAAKRTVVWHKRDFRDTLPVKLALKPYRSSMLFCDRYHAAVEELVGRTLPHGQLRYFLGPEDRASAERVLAAAGVDLARPIVGLSPGANWKTKRWPQERFAALAARALKAGFQVVVQGSADEAPLGRSIVAAAPGAGAAAGAGAARGSLTSLIAGRLEDEPTSSRGPPRSCRGSESRGA